MTKTIFHHIKMRASSRRGGALIYILIAIALLAALTTTFMGGGGQQSRTQNAFKLASELNSQGRVIRSGIQDCILRFPGGDSDIVEAGYIQPYPLTPTSTQLTTPATDRNVSRLGCPGTSAATGANPGSSDDHILLFGGGGQFSSYLPPAPDLMEEWQYFNGNFAAAAGAPLYNMAFNGVFYQIASDRSDPFIGEAMQKIDESMAACEVDHTIGSGSNGCETGHQCLRFWIIRTSGGPRTADGAATAGTNPCP